MSNYDLKPVGRGVREKLTSTGLDSLIRKNLEVDFNAPLKKHKFKETALGAYNLQDLEEIRK